MKTFLRYSIRAQSREFLPFKAPENIQQIAQELLSECHDYRINGPTSLVLVPIIAPEYELIMKFKSDYPDYASQSLIYEHKFSAKEILEADYLLLKSSSMILPKRDSNLFSRCCDKSSLVAEQQGSFRVGQNDFKNKVISGTSAYRYFISPEAKQRLEGIIATNFKYIPVFSARNPDPVAFQIEAEDLMPPLEPYNHWGIYKRCDNCGKTISNSIHEFPQPFTIPQAYKKYLKDFNATAEVFTEIVARHYVISKRVYDLFLSLGAKKLICEPVVFSD